MKTFKCIVISIVFLIFCSTGKAASEQNEQLATLSELLYVIYEGDSSAIPTTEEGIAVLEFSADSRDLLAFTIFQMMKDVEEGFQSMSPGFGEPEPGRSDNLAGKKKSSCLFLLRENYPLDRRYENPEMRR